MIELSFKAHKNFDAKGAYALLADSSGGFHQSTSHLDKMLSGALDRAWNVSRVDGSLGDCVILPAPTGAHDSDKPFQPDYVFLLGCGNSPSLLKWQDLGGRLAKEAQKKGVKNLTLVLDELTSSDDQTTGQIAAEIGFGMLLGTYHFSKYFTKTPAKDKPTLRKIVIEVPKDHLNAARKQQKDMTALANAVFFTRDIVSEPANVIYPKTLAEKCQELQELGVEVEILNESKMRKLGMNALLGVGQGSANESLLVIMRWNGGAKNAAPVALVGKGVTFDTGGISIKSSAGMEEMKWDMGGSGAVIGTMHAAAGRKAKINLVGVVGLVENMPDGAAQRPGDVVKSMSGQTIEIINTDAEGRLVLADALHYTETKLKPRLIIDLATLTGAIVTALGYEYAGIFSDSKTLSDQLMAASRASGERIWPMPLDPDYDRYIKSDIADVRNTASSRSPGAITAARFLRRFVKDTEWAHIDIAGAAWNTYDKPTVPKGAAGFGVRLLHHWLTDNFG